MSDPQVSLSVSYHAWNRDCTQIALSPNTNEVWIYTINNSPTDATKWKRTHVLDEHAGQVSGVDWCPDTNLLVTCGHDRNAYVWRFDNQGHWKPTLVILRINRAATQVKWSPLGNKFAVASGAKCVPVCHFEEKNDWWVSKMIKKHKSTILSLAWCPNNKFLVTGSSDMKCRIFSAYLDGIDNPEDDGFGSVFAQQHEFGEILCEFEAKAWVHAVAWSPLGFRVAFASHSSTISFVQLLAESQPIVQTVVCSDVPLIDLQFLSDNSLIGTGWNANIDLFRVTGGSDAEPLWAFAEKLDKGKSVRTGSTSGAFLQARGLFSATVDKGAAFGQAPVVGSENTRHKNLVANLQLMQLGPNVVTKFSSAGLDGRVCVWDVTSLMLR